MTAAIYITLERKIEGVTASDVDGKLLARFSDNLDLLCESNNLRTVSSFVSANPIDLPEAIAALSSLPFFKEKWFDSKLGLQSIEFLASHVSDHSSEFPDGLKSDLDAARRVLETAARQDVRFHFTVDV